MSPTARVELHEVTLRAGDRLLLDKASAEFAPGKITLILGPSGAGKSLLLRVMAGLIGDDHAEIHVSGRVRCGEHDVLAGGDGPPSVGVVFQNFALFDEWSATDNVRFAAAHREQRPRDAASPPRAPAELLDGLRVPRDVRTASLSGGQRQRLAVARTLAYDPEVLLYDEPTSGLDRATAHEVAELIRRTHNDFGKTSIIVTHDDESLAPIADAIYFVDTHARSLHRLERDEWGGLRERLDRAVAPGGEPADAATEAAVTERVTVSKPRPAWLRVVGRVGDFFAGVSRAVETALATPWQLVPRWKSTSWGFRYLLHYLWLVAAPSAWLYMAIAGSIIGFVATYFTFRFLPYRSYTEPLIIEDLLNALGFSLYRILVPVLCTILIAARCGAAVASDVGGKVYGHQIDAMRTFGVRPPRYIATNILYAFLLGTPVLVAFGFVAARLTSLVVFATTHQSLGPFFWEAHFHRDLLVPGQWAYRGTGWLLAKLLLCAAGTGVIAYQRGMTPKHSTHDVSAGITSTILWATLHVLIVQFAFAFFEFESPPG